MERTFNNGIGMIFVVDRRGIDKVTRALKRLREPYFIVGEIKKGSRGVSFVA
jgi:phosphoribosylaminoimidazole (AIR) synthetase